MRKRRTWGWVGAGVVTLVALLVGWDLWRAYRRSIAQAVPPKPQPRVMPVKPGKIRTSGPLTPSELEQVRNLYVRSGGNMRVLTPEERKLAERFSKTTKQSGFYWD